MFKLRYSLEAISQNDSLENKYLWISCDEHDVKQGCLLLIATKWNEEMKEYDNQWELFTSANKVKDSLFKEKHIYLDKSVHYALGIPFELIKDSVVILDSNDPFVKRNHTRYVLRPKHNLKINFKDCKVIDVADKIAKESLENKCHAKKCGENTDVKDVILTIISNVLKVNKETIDTTKKLDTYNCTPDQLKEITDSIAQSLNIEFNVIDIRCDMTIDEVVNFISQISENRVVSTEVWDSTTFKKVIDDLDSLNMSLELLSQAGVESFGTQLVNVLTKCTDSFISIANSVKTMVFKMFATTKRSEMKAYYESHMIECNRIEGQPFDLFKDVDVDIPSGMTKNTYLEAIAALSETYDKLDIVTFALVLEKKFAALRVALSRETGNFADFNNLLPVINVRERTLEECNKTMDKIFTQNLTDTTKRKFDKVYPTMAEFKNTRVKLLDLERYISEANKLVSTIEDIIGIVTDITSIVETNEQLDKKFLENLIKVVQYCAAAADAFGVNMTRQLATEHNHICNLVTCWQLIK